MIPSHIEIKSTNWTRQDCCLHKEVTIATGQERATFRLLFDISRGPRNFLVPMTMLTLNFPLNENHSQDQMWFGLRLLLDELVGAADAFKCIERDGETTLVSVEKDVFMAFANALMAEHDWQLEVQGANGIMAQCPIHGNEGFSTEFLALMETAKTLNA